MASAECSLSGPLKNIILSDHKQVQLLSIASSDGLSWVTSLTSWRHTNTCGERVVLGGREREGSAN